MKWNGGMRYNEERNRKGWNKLTVPLFGYFNVGMDKMPYFTPSPLIGGEEKVRY